MLKRRIALIGLLLCFTPPAPCSDEVKIGGPAFLFTTQQPELGAVVIVIIPGSNAYLAGLRPNDQILAIEDEPTIGQDGPWVWKRLMGPVGSSVKISILRNTKQLNFSLVRQPREIFTGEAYFRMEIDRASALRDPRLLTPLAKNALIWGFKNEAEAAALLAVSVSDEWKDASEQCRARSMLIDCLFATGKIDDIVNVCRDIMSLGASGKRSADFTASRLSRQKNARPEVRAKAREASIVIYKMLAEKVGRESENGKYYSKQAAAAILDATQDAGLTATPETGSTATPETGSTPTPK